MMGGDDLAALAAIDGGGVLGAVTLGEGDEAVTVQVKALTLDQTPAFARAIRPLLGVLGGFMSDNVDPSALLDGIDENFTSLAHALAVATVRPVRDEAAEALASRIAEREALIRSATIAQVLELLLAVIQANKDFLRGRLMQALRTAGLLMRGAGTTASSPSSAPASPEAK